MKWQYAYAYNYIYTPCLKNGLGINFGDNSVKSTNFRISPL